MRSTSRGRRGILGWVGLCLAIGTVRAAPLPAPTASVEASAVTTLRETKVLLRQEQENLSAAALSADGKLAATGDFEGMTLWTLPEGVKKHHLELETYSLAFTPDSTLLAVGSNRKVEIVDVATGQVVRTVGPFGNTVEGIDFSRDGALLGTASHDGTLKIFSVKGGQLLRRVLTAEWGEIQKLCLGNWVNDVAFHPREDRVAAGSRDGTVRVWDPLDARQHFLEEGQAFERWPVSVAYSPEGSSMAAGWSTGAIDVWNLDTRARTARLDTHKDWVRALGFLDGSHLVSGSHDGRLIVWDLRTSRAVSELTAHDGKSVYDLDIHPASRTVITAGWDGTVRLWRAEGSR